MSFTLTPVTAEKGGGQVNIFYVLQDSKSGESFKGQANVSTLEEFKSVARARIAELENKYDLVVDLKPLLNSPLDLSPAAQPAPTPEQLFRADVQSLRHMASAVALGTKDSGDKDYADLLASVRSTLASNPTWVAAF